MIAGKKSMFEECLEFCFLFSHLKNDTAAFNKTVCIFLCMSLLQSFPGASIVTPVASTSVLLYLAIIFKFTRMAHGDEKY